MSRKLSVDEPSADDMMVESLVVIASMSEKEYFSFWDSERGKYLVNSKS